MGIEEKLEQGIYGKPQLKPDEYRQYLGTFRERVILAMNHQAVEKTCYCNQFIKLLQQLKDEYNPLCLKINDKLAGNVKAKYLKAAANLEIPATIIPENATSNIEPYALVLHSDHAVNQQVIDIEKRYPNLEDKSELKPNKTSLLRRIFKRI
ncbi:MAG: YueI family protein [Streptococcaceae bacterium]|jgi:uncharacterized protein YueI|nr:YueI family protein [Streptococcaceae bacterium]